MHGYDIHIPFDKDTFVFLGYRRTRLVQAVQLAALRVYGRFRRIDIFRYILVLAQRAASKGKHFTGEANHGIYDTPFEAVVHAPVIGTYLQAGIYKYLVRESGLAGSRKQVVGTVYGIAQVETLYRGIVYAALPEIAQSDVTAIVGVRKIPFKVLHGKFVGRQHRFALGGRLALFGGHLCLLYLDMVFPGQISQCLYIAQLLQLHEEAYRRPSFTATEAVTESAGLADGERGGALVVERT